MHTINLAALTGVGFLVIGAMLSVSDPALFDTPYALIMGPISWIVGCALMIAWAIGRVGLAVTHGSEISGEPPSTVGEKNHPRYGRLSLKQLPRASTRGLFHDFRFQ